MNLNEMKFEQNYDSNIVNDIQNNQFNKDIFSNYLNDWT